MSQPANMMPMRLPESMTRQDIGPYMRSLREHYGLNQQDVAGRLHLRLRYIQAIEGGEFDTLPGKVYAKGYVHTYAEFLGLDAVQVAEICFGEEPTPVEEQEHFIPAGSRQASTSSKKWVGVAFIIVVLIGLYGIMRGPSEETLTAVAPTSERATPVPEAMLAPMRRGVMPTPRNVNCLTGYGRLSCFYESRLMKRWIVPASAPSYARFAVGNSLPSKSKKKK